MAPPKVERIFSTSDELPENILRFSISMHDEDGNEIENVFMEFNQELWSPDQKRLTLLLDPCRIIRGVTTNDRLRQALVAGQRYKLVVDATWPDAQGQLEHCFGSATRGSVRRSWPPFGQEERQQVIRPEFGVMSDVKLGPIGE